MAWWRQHWQWSLLLVACSVEGCAFQNAGKQATQGAVQAVLSPALRQEIQRALFDDPELSKRSNQALQSAVDHIMDALEKKMDPLLQTALQSVTKQGVVVWDQLQPQIKKALIETVRESVHTALSQLNQDAPLQLRPVVQGLVRDGVETAIATGLAHGAELGPWAEKKLEPLLQKLVRSLVDTAVQSLAAQLRQQVDSYRIPPAQELVHRIGVGLGEGIGEGLAHSVARDPMKPLLLLVASVMGGLLLINGLVLLLLWRKYVHTNRSLVLFASQVIRPGIEPALVQAVQAAHAAVHHQGWLTQFLQRHGFITPPLASQQETPPKK